MTAEVEVGGRVGRGVAWSALNAAVLRLSQFLVGVLVAHLVSPREFGVYVVALTVYAIAFSINDIGVAAAIVRDRGRSDQIGPTVAAITMSASFLLAAIMVVAAPFLASGLGAPAATPAVRVIALTIVLAGISATSDAQLTRDFRQKERFIGDSSMFLVSSTVLIVMAVLGSGVMALAWSRVAGQLASTIVVILLAPKWYWPKFDRREAKGLLRFGLPLSGAGFVWFSIDNIDFMVVGRILGAVSLGFYNLAYNISSWPVSVFRNIVNNMAIPTLARVQESRQQLLENLAAWLSALAAVSFPVSALCLGVARPLVDAVYGSRWAPAATVLAILVAFGSVRGIVALFCDVFVAIGRTRVLLGAQLVWLGVLLPAMIIGVKLDGIRGAGWAHLGVATLLLMPMYLIMLQRLVGLSAMRLLRAMAPPLGAAAVAAYVAHLVAGMFGNPWVALVVGALCGLAAYVLLLAFWLIRLVGTLRALYGRKRAGTARASKSTGPRHAIPRHPAPRHAAPRLHTGRTLWTLGTRLRSRSTNGYSAPASESPRRHAVQR